MLVLLVVVIMVVVFMIGWQFIDICPHCNNSHCFKPTGNFRGREINDSPSVTYLEYRCSECGHTSWKYWDDAI